jgi:hypothetical protein
VWGTEEGGKGMSDPSDDDKCPHCGRELETGFGLAGGGFGPYTYCPEHGVIDKFQDPEMENEKA